MSCRRRWRWPAGSARTHRGRSPPPGACCGRRSTTVPLCRGTGCGRGGRATTRGGRPSRPRAWRRSRRSANLAGILYSGYYGAMNLGMLLDLAADGLGDRIAFGSKTDGLSYARIRELASAAAPGLGASGADTLALLDETGPAVPVALFAAAWAGMSYAPLNYKFQPDY